MTKDPRDAVKDLVRREGRRRVLGALIEEGISASTADKLVRGLYPSKVKDLVGMAIHRVTESLKNKAS